MNFPFKKGWFFFLFICPMAYSNPSNDTPFLPTAMPDYTDFGAKARAETLMRLDRFLEWITKQAQIAYHVVESEEKILFVLPTEKLIDFEKKYGYFSTKSPLVAKATDDKKHLQAVQELFEIIENMSCSLFHKKIAVGEALAKVLAYRNLQLGDTFNIPTFLEETSSKSHSYRVDKIFDLWNQMPAFGLVSSDPNVPAILIFRGTDLSLDKRSGWASVISDFDLSGPGYSVFQFARTQLVDWLKTMAKKGPKTCVMGFSLGGIMTLYTAILEPELVHLQGCMAFNPPGVSDEIIQKWKSLESEERPFIHSFVNKGDPVSKWGYLVEETYQVLPHSVNGPIQAHNMLISAQNAFELVLVDIKKENSSRGYGKP